MKKIIATFTAVLVLTFCSGQDVITKKSGEDVEARILKVGTEEVEYKKFDNLDGPLFTMLKSDILLIRYENGTKDIFDEEKSEGPRFSNDLFLKGQADASIYYKGYQPAGTGTLVVGLISPLVGLIPAIACSATPPKDENLDFPSSEFMKRSEYYHGYTLKAKKIKKGKVWKNWGIALGVNVLAVLFITAGQN